MRWRVVTIFALLYVVSFVDRLILALLVEPLKADLGLSDTQIGLLIGTTFALLYAFLWVPIAWLVDRGNRTRIAAAGILVWRLPPAGSGIVSSYSHLLPFLLCLTLGCAFTSHVYLVPYVDMFFHGVR